MIVHYTSTVNVGDREDIEVDVEVEVTRYQPETPARYDSGGEPAEYGEATLIRVLEIATQKDLLEEVRADDVKKQERATRLASGDVVERVLAFATGRSQEERLREEAALQAEVD